MAVVAPEEETTAPEDNDDENWHAAVGTVQNGVLLRVFPKSPDSRQDAARRSPGTVGVRRSAVGSLMLSMYDSRPKIYRDERVSDAVCMAVLEFSVRSAW